MNATDINKQIDSLVTDWCERKELSALAGLLPAWLSNNGLTDGWAELGSALRHVSNYQNLPPSDRDTLKRLWVEIDVAIRNR
jgi:hypothetical protein